MQNTHLSIPTTNSLYALAIEIKKELSGGGMLSDDNDISVRHIQAAIKHEWANLIKEEDEAREKKNIPPSSDRIKIYSCLSLVDSKDYMCSCTKRGGKFKKVVVPPMTKFKNTPFITFVGLMESGLTFTPASSITAMNAIDPIINKPQYFFAGNAIYVSLPRDYSLLCQVDIMGIPEDPADEGNLCFDIYSADWNCPEYMKARIKYNIIAGFGRNVLATLMNKDIRNNANPSNEFVTSMTP